jgi:hypothetical protein
MTFLFGFFSRCIHGLELGTEMETKEKQNFYLLFCLPCAVSCIYTSPPFSYIYKYTEHYFQEKSISSLSAETLHAHVWHSGTDMESRFDKMFLFTTHDIRPNTLVHTGSFSVLLDPVFADDANRQISAKTAGIREIVS